MPILGNIDIILGVNAAKVTSGTKQAGDALKGVSKDATTLKGVFGGLVASFNVGNALKSLPDAFMRVTDRMKEIGKQATAIGTTTDQLSKLQYIARQTGTDANTLNSALGSMQGALQNVAANGGGPAANALKTLGLDAKELVKEDPTVAFQKIATAMSGIKGHAEKAAAAEAIFGSSGKEMLRTLSAGGDQLGQLGDRFEKLGGNISELDRINVDQLYKAFDDVWTVVEGVGVQIVSALTPYVTALVDQFVSWGTEAVSVKDITTGALDAIGKAISVVADGLQIFDLAWKAVKAGATATVKAIVKGLAFVSSGLDGLLQQFGYAGTGATELLVGIADELEGTFKDQADAFNKALVGPSWGEQLKAVGTQATAAAQSINKTVNRTQALATSFGGVGTAVGDLAKKWSEEIELTNKSGVAAEIARQKMAGATEEQIKMLTEIGKRKNDIDTLKEIASPLDKLRMKYKQIEEDVANGLKSERVGQLEKQKAGQDFFGDAMSKHASALEAHTQEARHAIVEYSGAASKDPTKELPKKVDIMTRAIEKGNGYQSEIAKYLSNLQVVGSK